MTHRKLLENALRESGQFNRQVIASAREGIVVYDRELRYEIWNPYMEALTGMEASQVLGRNALNLFPYVRENGVDVMLRRALAGETVRASDFPYYVPQTGKSGWISGVYGPHVSASGDIIGVIGIIRDTTEQKTTESKIVANLREKELLIKEIHHRVKNNLQVISSLLNMQMLHLPDEETRQILKDSQNRIRSMALVHEKLYRSDDLGRIDMASYIRGLADHLLYSARTTAAPIEMAVEVKKVFFDLTTAIPLGLLLNELLTNSLKHAFPDGRKGRIEIDLQPTEDGAYALVYRDNGVGFSKASSGGDSLGLPLVELLMKQLGGSMEQKNEGGMEYRMILKEIRPDSKES